MPSWACAPWARARRTRASCRIFTTTPWTSSCAPPRSAAIRALPAKDIFDVEYWDLEQAKLRKGGKPAAFGGEVALVTGAASGIGKACVESLLARGAAVVALDLDAESQHPEERRELPRPAMRPHLGSAIQARAVQQAVSKFGGLDMLVLNAGIFPGGCRIESLKTEEWQKVMRINLDANLMLMRECHPFLKLAPRGGRVVVIGSKNVPAPGPGAAAYSASKAALNQLARVAALEWGADNIRINSLHPNAVFDTGLWTDGGAGRARQALRPHRGRIQEEQRAEDRSDQPRRGRTDGGNVRPAVRQDHGRLAAGGWRERPGDLGVAGA